MTKKPNGSFVAKEGYLRAFSVLSIFLAWLVLTRVLGATIMPGPLETFEFLVQQFERGELTRHIGATMLRVLIAFVLAMFLGVTIGVASGVLKWLDQLLEAWLLAGLTIPRIVLFVMAYLMFGLNDRSAIIALVLAVVPTVIAQLREGTRALDPKLLEMARAYKRPAGLIWRKVILPQLLPYLIGTARGALSLSWKMVILAELLGRTSGVGYQISFYFQLFNMKGILAYGVTMMIVLAMIDVVFVNLVERRALRWRRHMSYGN